MVLTLTKWIGRMLGSQSCIFVYFSKHSLTAVNVAEYHIHECSSTYMGRAIFECQVYGKTYKL